MTDQVVSPGPVRPTTPPPPAPPEPGRAREVHRYPGSPPFGDSELDRLLFRGRAREVDAVLHSVLSYDLLLVYAVSGLGKTSLLTAGVLQPLRDRGYFPVICRLNNPGRPFVELVDAQIREAGRAQGVEVRWMPGADGAAAPTTLWDLLCGLEIWRGNTLQQLVLVLDQFEELFTLGWSADERAVFIEEFGAVVRRHRTPATGEPPRAYELPPPNVKFVLLIREDFLGQLEALAVEVPQIMQHRFRLDGLSPDQTAEAIREPAVIDDPRLRTRRFTYSAEAADAILTFLRTKEERGKEVLTPSIDPSQLQIICQHIERVILPTKSAPDDAVVEITAQDLGGRQGLDRIVGDFYRREIEDFPRRQRAALRKLCESGLISQSARRLSLEEGEIFETYHVDRATLADLVDRRLLRSEPRVGSVYYELAHDTLTAPILAYREERRTISRRRRLSGLLVAVGLVAVAGLAIAAAKFGADEARAQTIASGTIVSDAVDAAGDIVEYELSTTSDEPIIVHVEPGDGLNAVVDVTDPKGFRQSVDRNAAGQPETLVVTNGGAGTYRIGISGYRSSTGPFDVSVTQAPARGVSVGDVASATALASEAALFEFDAAAGSDLIVEVTPYDQLDPQLELIDPAGNRVGTVVDDTGVGAVERIVLRDPEPGRYQLLVTPYRSSSGQFGLSVRPVDVVDVALGETVTGRLNDGADVAVFEFEAPDDGLVAIAGRPATDAGPSIVLDVAEPGAGTTSVDDTAGSGRTVALVDGGARGRYRVVVRTWDGSGGPFELAVHPVDVTSPPPGEAVTVRTTAGLAVVEFAATEHELLAVEATPGAGSQVWLEVSGPAVAPVTVEGTSEDPAATLVNPVVSGGYRALVRSDTDGADVSVSVGPPATAEVTFGAPASGSLGAGEAAVLTFETTDDRPVAVALGGEEESYVDVEVVDPAGVSTWGVPTDFGLADAVVVDGGRGSYSAIVRAYDTSSDFELIVQPLDVPDAEVGDVVRVEEPGEIAAVDIAVEAGQLLAISAHVGSATAIGLDVHDAAGTVVTSVASVEVPTASTLVAVGDAGSYRVIVRMADASGPLDVVARPVVASAVAPGSTTAGALREQGDMAVYDIDVPDADGGPLLVSLVPADGLRPIIDVEGPGGTVQTVDALPDGGRLDLVVDGRSGRHRVTVRSDGSTGAFELAVRPVDVATVAAGATAGGELGADAAEVLDVIRDDDGPFTIDVAGRDGLDAVVTVIDPAGAVTRVDAAGVDEPEQVQLAGTAGTYRTIVAARAPGAFELSVGVVAPESIVVGGRVEGALVVPGDVAVYAVDVTGDDPIGVVVEPDPTFDPIVTVSDPSGTVTELDDGAAGDRETLTPSGGPGRYQIEITGYEGSVGAFALTVAG